MTHPYPPRLRDFDYIGRYSYHLEFTTLDRRPLFETAENVELVRTQLSRACRENAVAVAAWCFMPDHLHMVVDGLGEDAAAKEFIGAFKQYSGFYFKRARRETLWQRYGFDRVLRDETERMFAILYVIANPVTAGLVSDPADYPFVGSELYSWDELRLMSDAVSG